MDSTTFRTAFFSYAAKNRLWNEMLTKPESGDLNELAGQVMEEEDAILRSFGLPHSLQYSYLLQDASLNDLSLDGLDSLRNVLEKDAIAFLSSAVVSDRRLLLEAQEKGLYIDEVLPLLSLKLKAEPYYVYLYFRLFLQKRISVETFLEEVRIVALQQLGRRISELLEKKSREPEREYEELCKLGLQFLDSFLLEYPDVEREFLQSSPFHNFN